MRLIGMPKPHPDPMDKTLCGVILDEEAFDFALMYRAGMDVLTPGKRWEESLLDALHSGQLKRIEENLRTLPRSKSRNKRRKLGTFTPRFPLSIASFRDFYAFEQHVKNARKKRGLEMVPEWYEAPVFYFSNTSGIVGPGSDIRKPPETNELDYELELAVVIGKEGRDIPVAAADDYILGFTILNDWSARDIQRREMKVGLGPAKGKDFATSIGPYLVTPDELADSDTTW
jgi:fumarylacetoacetate (FAA) hydrolase